MKYSLDGYAPECELHRTKRRQISIPTGLDAGRSRRQNTITWGLHDARYCYQYRESSDLCKRHTNRVSGRGFGCGNRRSLSTKSAVGSVALIELGRVVIIEARGTLGVQVRICFLLQFLCFPERGVQARALISSVRAGPDGRAGSGGPLQSSADCPGRNESCAR